ncbi:MAG: FkbM family methyltransferase [Deltaproteobacteria bacterium]|nr:FkbM family methyltransferase [Deltaproteobacteria bacterium]
MKNISLNDFSNIKVFNMALGNESKEKILIVPYGRNMGGAYLTSINSSDGGTKVAMNMLDSFVMENQISKIDLIKIDVEGYEFNVLNGAKESIKKYKPKLFIEVDDNHLQRQGISVKELIEFISTFGYFIIKADTGQEITKDYNFKNVHFDIICRIPK